MNLIVAVDSEWGIGCGGELLAHIPGDLKYFKETTMDKVVVMGRKTLESLPGKKGLPKRVNFVLTGNPEFEAERCRGREHLPSVLRTVRQAVCDEDACEPECGSVHGEFGRGCSFSGDLGERTAE